MLRSRRLRTTQALRDLVAETDLRPRHLVQPYFVQAAEGVSPIESLPGIARTGPEATCRQVEADLKRAIKKKD